VKTTSQNLQTASTSKRNKTDLFTKFSVEKICKDNTTKKINILRWTDVSLIRENNWNLKGGEQRYTKL
jgi:hypothetical protein